MKFNLFVENVLKDAKSEKESRNQILLSSISVVYITEFKGELIAQNKTQ